MQKLVKQSDPNVHWPEPRRAHSSAVISSRTVSNGVLKHYLLVLGGESDVDSSTPITNDCWVMDMDSKQWGEVSNYYWQNLAKNYLSDDPQKIILPKSVSMRKWHSATSFKMSANCVWLLIVGGVDDSELAIASPEIVNLVELGMTCRV